MAIIWSSGSLHPSGSRTLPDALVVALDLYNLPVLLYTSCRSLFKSGICPSFCFLYSFRSKYTHCPSLGFSSRLSHLLGDLLVIAAHSLYSV